MNWKATKIEQVAIKALKPYERNARTHSQHQIELLKKAIREFGFTTPVLLKADGTIVAGHGRVEAARQMDLEAVPAIYVDHLSERQVKALVLADNKIAANAGWDMEKLADELNELAEMEMDLEVTGFDEQEIDTLLRSNLDLLPSDPFTNVAYNEPRDTSMLTGGIPAQSGFAVPTLPTEDKSAELMPVGQREETSRKIEMIEFRKFKIPVGDAEADMLEAKLDEHVQRNGSIVGFFAYLFEHEVR